MKASRWKDSTKNVDNEQEKMLKYLQPTSEKMFGDFFTINKRIWENHLVIYWRIFWKMINNRTQWIAHKGIVIAEKNKIRKTIQDSSGGHNINNRIYLCHLVCICHLHSLFLWVDSSYIYSFYECTIFVSRSFFSLQIKYK